MEFFFCVSNILTTWQRCDSLFIISEIKFFQCVILSEMRSVYLLKEVNNIFSEKCHLFNHILFAILAGIG